MTNIIPFIRKSALAEAKIERKAMDVLSQAIYDRRFSRNDLEILTRLLSERPRDGSLSAYLSSQEVIRSCAKFVALGLLESDGPYECIAPSGVSAGWFQSFQFVGDAT